MTTLLTTPLMTPSIRDRIPRQMLDQRPWLAWLLLAAAASIAYANSFSGVFVLDDHRAIGGDPSVRTLVPPWVVFVRPGRAVTQYTLSLNYAFGGLEVFGYHVANLAIHLAAGLTLFHLVRGVLRREAPDSMWNREASTLALIAALLWLVHPVQTESVTYIIQRAESLMGLFYLLTLDAILRGAEAGEKAGEKAGAGLFPRIAWYGAAILACALGMKSKEVMATAPIAAVVFDRVYLSASWGDLVRKRWAVHLGLFATWGLLFGSVREAFAAPETASAGFNTASATPLEYALTQPGVILHYLGLAIIPYPTCIDRDWPVTRSVWDAAPAGLALATLIAAAAWLLSRRPKLGFLAVAPLLILAPTSSVMPIADVAVDHRMYLPLAPLIVLIVSAGRLAVAQAPRFGWDEGRVRRFAGLAAGAAAAVFVVLTLCRNVDYSSEIVLWESVLAVSPDNRRAHNNLAMAWDSAGALDKAEAHYRESIRPRPGSQPLAAHRSNYAAMLARVGRVEEAVAQLRQAVNDDPTFALAWGNLAVSLARLGKDSEAAVAARKGLEADPALASANLVMATTLERNGDLEHAETHYRAAVVSGDLLACRLYGKLLLKLRRPAEATGILRDALRLSPGDALLWSDLGFAHAESGDEGQGKECFQKASSLDPNWPAAAATAAWSMATDSNPKARDGDQAIRLARQSLMAGDVEDPVLLDTLAAAQAESGRFADAAANARLAADGFNRRGDRSAENAVLARAKLYESGQSYRGGRGYR